MNREVREISHDEATPFFMRVHYARALPQMVHTYGLFIDNTLCGVVSYGIPASPSLCRGLAGDEEFYNVLELNRLVICDPTPNNASYLVGHSLRMLPKHRYVVSYADWGGVGTRWVYLSGLQLSLHWSFSTQDRCCLSWSTFKNRLQKRYGHIRETTEEQKASVHLCVCI